MSKNSTTVPLGDIVNLRPLVTPNGLANGAILFGIARLADSERFKVFTTIDEFAGSDVDSDGNSDVWLATGSSHVGDNPQLYHPAYLMAVTASEDFFAINQGSGEALPSFNVPAISFTTDEWTRRSMTLNGMRMSTEFFGSGSLRVLELVKQRLEAGQRDVIHDVLVYLMRQILQERALADEERTLRAESLAAYLGVDPLRVHDLLRGCEPQEQKVVSELIAGFAGPVRRQIDVARLVANQLQLFRSEMRIFALREQNVLNLIDPVVALLYAR